MELIAKARAGEIEALGELCNLYRNYMRMVVRTGLGPKLRERVELSDVVQEALVEVIRQFPQFTGQNEAALVGWLRRLVGQKLQPTRVAYHSRAKRLGEAVPTSRSTPPGICRVAATAVKEASSWTCSLSARPARGEAASGLSC